MSREFCQCFGQSVDVSGTKKNERKTSYIFKDNRNLISNLKIATFGIPSASLKKQNSGRNFANDVDGFILPLPKQQSLPNDSSNWNIEPINNVNWFCFYLLDLTFCGNLKHTLRNKEIFQRPKRN